MSKHTPGPWAIGPVGRRGQIIEVPGGHIAEAYGESHEEQSANAKLIAAAPELLAACRAALRETFVRDAAPVLRAAIAKAES